MAATSPLTNFPTYLTEAHAIRQHLRESPGSPEAVRQAVMDLADLAAKGLEEAAQVFEGLALVVLSHHPDVRRAPRRLERAPRAKAAARPEPAEARRRPAPGGGEPHPGLDAGAGVAGYTDGVRLTLTTRRASYGTEKVRHAHQGNATGTRLTSVALAKKAKIGPIYLAQIEGSAKKPPIRMPSLPMLERLAKALQVPVGELVT